MSQIFRNFLQKVGSGRHTSEALTRSEAKQAARMMLLQEATPAQIGAFMIAHRIKRPTPEELAGFLDAYDEMGPKLKPIDSDYLPLIFGLPYDGRDRTAPLQPLISLILSAMGCPVVLHGGNRMPTKYGVPIIEIWHRLGIDWTGLQFTALQEIFRCTKQGFIYLPDHFTNAHALVPYRDQIGKRPPLATIELMWCPYDGACKVIVGYVHPPTEELAKKTLTLTNIRNFTTVKGLEGSSDLPCARAAIIGSYAFSNELCQQERLLLHARDYDLGDQTEVAFHSLESYMSQLKNTLNGDSTLLSKAAVWNSGFYLWHSGVVTSLDEGIETSRNLLNSGQVLKHLSFLAEEIRKHAV